MTPTAVSNGYWIIPVFVIVSIALYYALLPMLTESGQNGLSLFGMGGRPVPVYPIPCLNCI